MRREINLFDSMTTANKILVYCLKDEPLATTQARITGLLGEPIDWNSLILQSGAHGVNCYLYHALKGINGGLIPSEALQKLENSYLAELVRSASLSSEVSRILDEFEKEKVENILLKGAFLDEKVYSQPSFRVYSDIDVLVRKTDVPRAKKVLARLGYAQINESKKFIEREGKTQLHFYNSNSVVVDLHWEALNSKWYPNVSRYFNDSLWANACPLEFNGSATWALPAEDLLIYQCIHLAVHHDFFKLIWFKDVDQVLRYSRQINWEIFLGKVKKYHLTTYCYYALYFAKVLLDSPVSEHVLNELQPQFLMARVFEFFISRENLLEISKTRWSRSRQTSKVLRDGFWERLGALRYRVFPSVQWYLRCYPFLPRTREVYYFPIYPLLMLLRLMRRPTGQVRTKTGG